MLLDFEPSEQYVRHMEIIRFKICILRTSFTIYLVFDWGIFLIIVEKMLFLQWIFIKSLFAEFKINSFLKQFSLSFPIKNIDIAVVYRYTIHLNKKLFNCRLSGFSSDICNTWKCKVDFVDTFHGYVVTGVLNTIQNINLHFLNGIWN